MSKALPHRHQHTEHHFTAGEFVRDVVIGMSDGLTVPFALAAGLASATGTSALVVTAGLAEIAAGAISMGLGGYLAGRSEIEHYARERHREEREIRDIPEEEEAEISAIFAQYGVEPGEAEPIIRALKRQPEKWRDFMMKFELGLDEPNPKRALAGALTIGGAYAVGGLFPLAPYVLVEPIDQALLLSVVITLAALFVFGYVKSRIAGTRRWAGALRTMVIGGLAALAAFAIAKLVS